MVYLGCLELSRENGKKGDKSYVGKRTIELIFEKMDDVSGVVDDVTDDVSNNSVVLDQNWGRFCTH